MQFVKKWFARLLFLVVCWSGHSLAETNIAIGQRVAYVAKGEYTMLIEAQYEITNTGSTPVMLVDAIYDFRAANEAIQKFGDDTAYTDFFPPILMPGESGYANYLAQFYTPYEEGTVAFDVNPIFELTDKLLKTLEVQGMKWIKDERFGEGVWLHLSNRSGEDLSRICVAIAVRDKQGNLLKVRFEQFDLLTVPPDSSIEVFVPLSLTVLDNPTMHIKDLAKPDVRVYAEPI
jgi:hypothetical protein